jgi:2-polyprenyl-6-methoxyphenol hydroxylase-like FAD-dependent oxidoreductase
MAGSLAAAALAADPGIASVTVVERDRLPAGPEHRKGLPQGHHAHVLMSGGARTVEALVPGTLERLAAAGAHRIGLPDGYVMLMPQGWLPRWTTDQYVISCTRALLDQVVRQAVFAMPGVRLREDTEVTGLTGDAAQVTGVQVRDRKTGAAAELPADFVVDATGRGSRARDWLAALGLPSVREDVVDSGLMYATRLFRAPGTAGEGFPVVNVQADPDSGGPGQTAALMPVEGGRWLVTAFGGGGVRGIRTGHAASARG